MKANFHTHTYRCHHAEGEDVDFVKAAIKAGIKTLGFSDHGPHVGFTVGHAMDVEDVSDYVLSVLSLKENFKDKIDIHLGFELEYFPEFFEDTIKFYHDKQIEYLILGQHSLSAGKCYSAGIVDYETSFEFVDVCCNAMNTGAFSYIAHPDIFNFDRNDKRIVPLFEKICVCATENNMPVEFNLLGFATNRNYPCEKFVEIVGATETKMIIGRDAHYPEAFLDKDTENKALDLLNKYNVNITDEIDMTRLAKLA